MPELSSSVTQSGYTTYLIDIYQHWNEYPNARRGTLFDGAIRQVLRQCALPEPALRWAPGGGFGAAECQPGAESWSERRVPLGAVADRAAALGGPAKPKLLRAGRLGAEAGRGPGDAAHCDPA